MDIENGRCFHYSGSVGRADDSLRKYPCFVGLAGSAERRQQWWRKFLLDASGKGGLKRLEIANLAFYNRSMPNRSKRCS